MIDKSVFPILAMLAILLWIPMPCKAEIYRYQRNGVWHYTDTPPTDMPAGTESMVEIGQSAPASSTEGTTTLLADFPAGNAVERAAAGTVAIKSPLGYGSGFFITPDGFIVTNKHVIRTTEPQSRKSDAYFEKVENRIDEIEEKFADEKNRMRSFEKRLAGLEEAARSETHPDRKRAYQEDYEENLKALRDWQEDYAKRRKRFETEKSRFRSGRQSYDYSRSVADLAQSFLIILADNTELYARLITTSAHHDLALLKVDGYHVPFLAPANNDRLIQSTPLFAVGNPARLQNSVTSGIFSGYQQGFIQTNAQIYPGNSGGPLVTESGHVVGINTFKKLTHKFEGLGFAIPIQIALKEFSRYLPAP